MSVYPFIEAEKAERVGNVVKTCLLLEVSRSAYYQWSNSLKQALPGRTTSVCSPPAATGS